MARIAILNDINEVLNVIEAPSVEVAEAMFGTKCVVALEAGHGAVFDVETGEFITPEPIVEEPTVDEPVAEEPVVAPKTTTKK